MESYSAAAEKLALNAFRAGDVNGLIPCQPASASDVKCRPVRPPSLRAFAGPAADEFQRYTAAFSAQARATGKFLEGARPSSRRCCNLRNFSSTSRRPMDAPVDYAIASRLSYLLWDTPDKVLLEAAERGECGLQPAGARGLPDARQSARRSIAR